MLIPVDVPSHQRIWADVAFRYEKYIYADAPDEVSRYLLKYGHVEGTYTDEQISGCVRRSFVGMLRDGVPRCRALQEVSEVYGIPPACVSSVVDGAGNLSIIDHEAAGQEAGT